MAKSGKETPKPIQDFIRATKKNAWALTYAQIEARVEAEFGEESAVDKSTVGRILRRAGLTGGRHSPYKGDGPAPQSDKAHDGHQRDPSALGMGKILGSPTESATAQMALHQEDLIRLLGWLLEVVHTPCLGFQAHPADFGLESLLGPQEVAGERVVPLGYVTPGRGFDQADPFAAIYGRVHGPAGVEVVLVNGNPEKVRFHRQEEVIWQSLQQHLEGTHSWDDLSMWQEALLEECRARGDLNAAIKEEAERTFHAPVERASPPEGRLTQALIWQTREELTRMALGLGASDLLERVTQGGGKLDDPQTGAFLTTGLDIDQDLERLFGEMVNRLAGCGEATAAATAHRNLTAATEVSRRSIDGHRVRHQVPGKCEWCRRETY